MLKLISDENFNGDILRGLFRRNSKLDVVRVQDVGLEEATDPEALQWAAGQGRVVLTHDRGTMPHFATQSISAGQPMHGLVVESDTMPIGQAVDEILLAVECLTEDECRDHIYYFPL